MPSSSSCSLIALVALILSEVGELSVSQSSQSFDGNGQQKNSHLFMLRCVLAQMSCHRFLRDTLTRTRRNVTDTVTPTAKIT